MVPVGVELGGRPGVVDPLALLEDGGDGLVPRSFDLGAVRCLDEERLLGLAIRVHKPRLRFRRFGVTRSRCEFPALLGAVAEGGRDGA
jgi:hypothetical protein